MTITKLDHATYDCDRVARARIEAGRALSLLTCCSSCHSFGVGMVRAFRGARVTVCCRAEISTAGDMAPIFEDGDA